VKSKSLRPIKLGAILLIILASSTAFLVIAPKLWNELSLAQAQKQSLRIPSWAPLVERSQNAVVVITTEAMIEHPPLEFPGLPGPFRFFMPIPPERQRGQGSGFIINKDGYVITNQHVIDGAQTIKIAVGLREYQAEVIGADKPLDIALLKIKADEKEKIIWPYLPLGDSDKMRLGDPVLALGSPLGLVQSVNVGIISHKHREGLRPSGRDLFVELMQLAMPGNPGYSGGPVLNDSGEVIGVIESILASGQAITFCLPINMIKAMIPQLLSKGQIDRAYLGVEPDNLTPPQAEALGLPLYEKGAVILKVIADTPAKRAGLRPMDVILEIDGQKVMNGHNLRNLTAYKPIGQPVKLKIHREGVGTIFITVKLEKRPEDPSEIIKPDRQKVAITTIDSVGLEVSDTPEAVQKELMLQKTNPGAQVVGISPGSSASFADLQPGDVITIVDRVPITSAKHLKTLIDKVERKKTLLLLTRRGNDERFVALEKQ
jgi:serine protease Do